MGNTNCCSTRKKNIKSKYIKEIDISEKLIKKSTNIEIKNKISIIKSNRFDNICFSLLYGIGTIGGIVLLCFVPEPSVGISVFLMSGSLTYYIKRSVKSQDEINKYISELERRTINSIKIVDIGKLHIDS